jgi:transposase InsO family protein
MIKELSVDFDIKDCCEALRVSRSGYYRWRQAEPSRRAKENAALVEQTREVFEANKSRYGSPRVTRELRQRGLKCGRNRIARLMRENELAARAKRAFRPRTTLPKNELTRLFEQQALNELAQTAIEDMREIGKSFDELFPVRVSDSEETRKFRERIEKAIRINVSVRRTHLVERARF